MSDTFVQVAPNSTGAKVDASQLLVGVNTVDRQRIVIASDSAADGFAPVDAATGLSVNVTNSALPVTQGGSFTVQPITFASAQQVVFAAAQPVTQSGTWRYSPSDGPSNDAFSRLRVSEPVTLFDSSSLYGDNGLVWESAVVGTGVLSNNLAAAAVQLSTGGTASGAKCTRQTLTYFRYQPGKSQLVFTTFLFGAATANLRRRIGYFDNNNGVFLEQTSAGPSVVVRSAVSGSPVDTIVAQADWNLDKLDGTGTTGITLDLSKVQILIIDLQWLGVGRVRFGFDIGGQIIYCHQVLHANTTFTTVYMQTACLPMRQEIENTGITAGTNTMQAICSAVSSEGGFEGERGQQFTSGNGATGIAITTRRPLCSVRAKTTGPNSVRNTGQIVPFEITVLAGTKDLYFEVVRTPTSLTGASWAAFSATNSLAEIDVAATAISGGQVLDTGYCTAGQTVTAPLHAYLPLGYSGLNNTQASISVVATSLTTATTSYATITWREFS